MKYFFLFLFPFFAGQTFAAPGIREALKNPSAVTVLKFSGEKEEAALFVKNASRFTALTQVLLAGIFDSILAEHDIAAIAACPSVTKVSFDKCGFAHLSYAIKMLVSVKEVEISNCPKLNIDGTFSCLAGMPSLKSISYSTSQLVRIPKSFQLIRGLDRISISNTDLSLADGYALNTQGAKTLFVNETLQLGFGTSMLLLEYSCYDKKSAKEHISIMRDMLQGVACLNGEMILPHRTAAFTKQHPLVKPPIAGLDIQKNVYTTDATTGGAIEYPSGTRIFIPDHAFVDKDGNTIDGNVAIDYREFRDQVDILVSGIPMTYDSAGQKGNFESAGMFEINASVDGQEVFLAPGKKLDLEFAVVDTTADYNFYHLDEEKGWIYQEHLGKTDNPVAVEEEDTDYLPAFAFHRRTLVDLRRMPKLMDTTSLDARYADITYGYMEKNKKYAAAAAKDFFFASHWSLKKIVSKKAYCCFKINRRYRNGNNPEMSAFSNVIWKTTDNVRTKELKRLFRKKNGINDIRIYFDGSGFQLEFKTYNGFRTIAAVPVRVINNKTVEYTAAMNRSRYKLYSRMLDQRKRRLTKDIKNNKNNVARWKRKLSADSVRHWKKLRPVMSQHQKNMSYAEWVAFAGKQKFNSSAMNPMYSLSAAGREYNSQAYQKLSTFRFGIFNCDHTLPLPEPQEIFALCNVNGVKSKGTSTIYLLDQRRNMTITYNAMDESSPVPIAFGKTHSYALVAISWDGLVSVGDADAFRTRRPIDDHTCVFETTSVSDQPLSAQDLRMLLLKSK
jgi:hypothetical protein